MATISCPHCTYSIPVNEIIPGSKVQCPSCGEFFEVPAMPPAPPVSREATGGGVFAMGALLLVAVVIAVVLFWGGLLKKREAPRPKHDEKKQGGIVHRQAGFWLRWPKSAEIIPIPQVALSAVVQAAGRVSGTPCDEIDLSEDIE
jgi:hypothetical protein